MPNRISVSSADFIRSIGYWQNEALRQPISITHHGRERLVLAAPDAFQITGASDEVAKSLAKLRADVAVVQENLGDGYLSIDAQLPFATATPSLKRSSARRVKISKAPRSSARCRNRLRLSSAIVCSG